MKKRFEVDSFSDLFQCRSRPAFDAAHNSRTSVGWSGNWVSQELASFPGHVGGEKTRPGNEASQEHVYSGPKMTTKVWPP